MRITNTTDAERARQAIRADLAVIAAGIRLTLRRLDDMTGGYPSSASGADRGGSGGGRTIVDPAHPDDPVPATGVEIAAIDGRDDRARTDLARLLEHLAGALVCARLAAAIATDRPAPHTTAALTAATAAQAVETTAKWVQIADTAPATLTGQRRGLWDALGDLARHSGRAAGIVGRYTAPQLTAKERATLVEEGRWCANAAHGLHLEPRRSGCHYCGWCLDVRRTYGKLPTAGLADRHTRHRISDNEYRAAFGLPPIRKRSSSMSVESTLDGAA